MDVKCTICGRIESISKLHKDYRKLVANPKAIFICEMCNYKLSDQASKKNAIMDKK